MQRDFTVFAGKRTIYPQSTRGGFYMKKKSLAGRAMKPATPVLDAPAAKNFELVSAKNLGFIAITS